MIGKTFKFLENLTDIDLDDVDFLDDATNVYRTEEFIVKQHLTYITDGMGSTRILSEDTFYCRTKLRDALYEQLFKSDGKRIRSAMYVRTYIE